MKKVLFTVLLFWVSGVLLMAQNRDSVYFRAKVWNEKIKEFKDADARQFPRPGAILFVGSSSFTRWENLEEDFCEYHVINRGFGGSHLSDVLYYMEQIVFSYKPAQIVLYEGDNDIGSRLCTPETYLDDVKTFVRMCEIRLPGVPIIILSIKSSPARNRFSPDYEKGNQLVYDYCRTKSHVKFVDVSGLMTDSWGNYIPEYYAKDSLHISPFGYKRWATAIKPYLVKSALKT